MEEYDDADRELGELLPELDGLDELEASLARGRSAQWTEQTDLAIEMAERAIALAERLDAKEQLAPAYGRLSQALAMRGDPGDLDRAKETGDHALRIWTPETHLDELAEHNVMHAHTYYWTGRFAEGVELARAGRAIAVDSGSREALLRGGTREGASLDVTYQTRLRLDGSANELVYALNRIEGVQKVKLERHGSEQA